MKRLYIVLAILYGREDSNNRVHSELRWRDCSIRVWRHVLYLSVQRAVQVFFQIRHCLQPHG